MIKQAHNVTHTNSKMVYILTLVCCFLRRRDTEVFADEGSRTVFLTVSRSNGLGSAVSVEWATQSDTAVASG